MIIVGVSLFVSGSVVAGIFFSSGTEDLKKYLIPSATYKSGGLNVFTIKATNDHDIILILWTEPKNIPVKLSIKKNGTPDLDQQFTKELTPILQNSKVGDIYEVALKNIGNDSVTVNGIVSDNFSSSHTPHSYLEFTTVQYHDLINQVWIGVGVAISGITVIIAGTIIFFIDRKKI